MSDAVVAIVQSRMGSSRLPGKMLRPLCGQPLLAHILSRTLALETADHVVLATTTSSQDDPLVELAEKMGVAAVRGSEEDVLSRFFLALEKFPAKMIVRICGDAPLFSPTFSDMSVRLLQENDADLVVRAKDVPTAYHGAGALSVRALEWTRQVAGNDPLAREHVTAYAQAHAHKLRTVPVSPHPKMLGEFHLSIDTAEDFAAMERIYEQLYVPGQIVPLRAALDLIRSDPSYALR